MRVDQRLKFNQFIEAIADFYSVDKESVIRGESFNIEPLKEAKLLGNIQKQSGFLNKINVVQVNEIEGMLMFGATEKGITGRKSVGRFRTNVGASGYRYKLAKTDSGVLIPWEMLDSWGSLSPSFQKLWADYVQQQIALDMVMVGFNGTSAAADTQAPDLSDVNIGWLEFVRRNAPAQMIGAGQTIQIHGKNADFTSLDELAYQLKQGLAERHHNAGDLVFCVGADLVANESKSLYKKNSLTATERSALNSTNITGMFGGMPCIVPENMPGKAAFVTSLDNLSIYTQRGSIRRGFKNDEELAAIVDSYYRNEGYAVEDPTKFCGIEAESVELGNINE